MACRWLIRVAVLLVAFLGLAEGPSPAGAHLRSTSYAILDILGPELSLYLEIDGLDLRETLPLDEDLDSTLSHEELRAGARQVEELFGPRMQVRSGQRPCQPSDLSMELRLEPQRVHLRQRYLCPGPILLLELSLRLFEVVSRSQHITHAHLRLPGGLTRHMVFSSARPVQRIRVEQPPEQTGPWPALRVFLLGGFFGLLRLWLLWPLLAWLLWQRTQAASGRIFLGPLGARALLLGIGSGIGLSLAELGLGTIPPSWISVLLGAGLALSAARPLLFPSAQRSPLPDLLLLLGLGLWLGLEARARFLGLHPPLLYRGPAILGFSLGALLALASASLLLIPGLLLLRSHPPLPPQRLNALIAVVVFLAAALFLSLALIGPPGATP